MNSDCCQINLESVNTVQIWFDINKFREMFLCKNVTTYLKGPFTSKFDSKTVPVLPSLIFPFHLLPSPVHPTGFSFRFFHGFLAIFILLSSNRNIFRPADSFFWSNFSLTLQKCIFGSCRISFYSYFSSKIIFYLIQ